MAPDFTSIDYLVSGNLRQQKAYEILTTHRIMELLGSYSPILVGTIPLGIDIESSDLDIVCFTPDPTVFSAHLTDAFAHCSKFAIGTKSVKKRPTVICRFTIESFPVEIFGQDVPSTEQDSFIHLVNENLILLQNGPEFKIEITRLKRAGMKTEPAFAQLLGLQGDPYEALLQFKADTSTTA
jgi:hypothetical protein